MFQFPAPSIWVVWVANPIFAGSRVGPPLEEFSAWAADRGDAARREHPILLCVPGGSKLPLAGAKCTVGTWHIDSGFTGDHRGLTGVQRFPGG